MFFIGAVRRWARDRGRNIFRFRDGGRWRHADPVAVSARLEEAEPGYQDVLFTLSKKPGEIPPGPVRDDLTAKQRDAAKRLAAAARKTFDLKPLDDAGGGTTDGEAVGVLAAYLVFMEKLADDARLFPNSQGAA